MMYCITILFHLSLSVTFNKRHCISFGETISSALLPSLSSSTVIPFDIVSR
ncbi:hypothetical protein LINPERHAP2_LOCUS34592 [Linum perenne]